MTSDRMRTSHVRRGMSERRGRLHALHVTIVAVGLLLSGLASPSSASAQPADPAQQLADKYAPVLMLKQQEAACDYAGEGYFPAAVDWLMSNPDVRFKAVGDGDDADNDPVLKTAPTLQDLVTAGPDTYLDFPGDPRNPGCGYEQYFKQKAAELGFRPTIYAKYVYAPSNRRIY